MAKNPLGFNSLTSLEASPKNPNFSWYTPKMIPEINRRGLNGIYHYEQKITLNLLQIDFRRPP